MMVPVAPVLWAWLAAIGAQIETQDIVAGSGAVPQKGDVVTVQIVAHTTDGRVLADTRRRGLPLSFQLGACEVEPWMEALVWGLRAGGARRVDLSFQDGYGEDGAPPIVPPKTRLTVSLTLLAVRTKQPAR